MNKVILLTHCICENYIVEKGDTKYACVKQEEKNGGKSQTGKQGQYTKKVTVKRGIY